MTQASRSSRFVGRKERRQKEAAERQEASDNLTPEERLRRLDQRFGEGKGATKERLRLWGEMAVRDNSAACNGFAKLEPDDPIFDGPAEPGQRPKRALRAKDRRARDRKEA